MYEVDRFFKQSPEYAVTYDDVLIVPRATQLTNDAIDISSRFTRDIPLRLPVISAAMDTVTGPEMAIALGEYGGIGVLPSSLAIKEQRDAVRKVKLYRNLMIKKPIMFFDDQTIAEALATCEAKDYHFRTFPIQNRDGKFVGLLTGKHFLFTEDKTSSIATVMTIKEEVVIADTSINVKKAYKTMMQHKTTTLPVIDKKGRVKGLYLFSDVLHDRTNLHHANLDKSGRLYTAAAVPTDRSSIERVAAMEKYLDVAVIDSAQGDTKYAFDTLKALKRHFPELQVVVGNITNPDSARQLVELGADAIKVGQGPGSICTTRQQLGIGYPQVAAVYNCAKAIRGSGTALIADGGIKELGDINKAIVAGADSVMLGSLFSATDETPGEVVTLENGVRAKVYRGMGSSEAMDESVAARKRYGAQGNMPLPEGVKSYVPVKGSVAVILRHIRQAMIRSMVMTDAQNIKSQQEHGNFVLLSPSGIAESGPHISRQSVRVI